MPRMDFKSFVVCISFFQCQLFEIYFQEYHQSVKQFGSYKARRSGVPDLYAKLFAEVIIGRQNMWLAGDSLNILTLVNVYVDLLIFTRIAGTS